MANDVSIEISAELGTTLIKLALAKDAIKELGTASEETAAKQDAATASTAFFQGALNGLNGVLAQSVPIWGGFAVPVAALPVLLLAAMVAVVALADAIGTLIAIVADFVAPVSLVVGLLGSLGLGFLLAGQRAIKGGGTLEPFAKKVDTLGSMFHKTAAILANAFLPYLLKLAGAAQQALLFIDKLAHMSLAEAFRTMATQGVQKLNDFINAVAKVLAHPIRLAFKIAFGTGPGGNEIASVVADWWHRFSDFLFGYTQKHQVHIGRFLGPVTTTQVDGIFQPLIDWFNRHHFTKQGHQIGHAILDGFTGSGASQQMGTFLAASFFDAIKTVGRGFYDFFHRITVEFFSFLKNSPIGNGAMIADFQHVWDYAKRTAGQLWSWIVSTATNAGGAIKRNVESALGTAWDWVKTKAQAIWADIVAIFTAPLHIHLSIPSISGAIKGAGGGILGVLGLAVPSGGSPVPVAGGGGGMVIHIHGGHFTDAASRRREAAAVGQEIARVWRQKAGG